MMSHLDTNGLTDIYDSNQNIDNASPEKQAIFFKKRYEELQADFDEYQLSSRELENELETQLAIYEKKVRDLEVKNAHLSSENEVMRNKLEKLTTESCIQLTDLQKKLQEVTALNEQLSDHIRDLEQSNDDLERAKRHLDATLSDFDAKLNEQIERNELLESEIGEKEQLQAVIQRLKDEARDLRLELTIQQSFKNNKKSSSPGQESESNANSPTSTKKSCPTPTSTSLSNGGTLQDGKPFNSSASMPTNHNTPKQSPTVVPLLSASSRISALNIVSDLLRKVGALESKLASCRSIVPVSGSLMRTNNNNNNNAGNVCPTNQTDVSNVNSPLKDINASA